jgi:N-acetylglutamate synthase and related acetyltransferases
MRCMRPLGPSELSIYREHLLRLDAEDRRLRFGCAVDDSAIDAHVRRLRVDADRILALLDEEGSVVAAAHIARIGDLAAELAFSVDGRWRRRGLCRALFEHALGWARSRGIRRVYLAFLSENGAMRTLARDVGMSLQVNASEVLGELMLPSPTPFSVLRELAAEQAALWPAALRPFDSEADPAPAFQPAA